MVQGSQILKMTLVITGYKKLVILSFDPVCSFSYTKGIEEVRLTMLYQLILKLLWPVQSGTYCRKIPNKYFNGGSTFFQRNGSTLKYAVRRSKWNKIWYRIFNVIQRGCNVGVQLWNNVEATLQNVDTMLFQLCPMPFQRCFNVDMTLPQRGVKVS